MSELLTQQSLAFERAIAVFRPSRIVLNQAVGLFRFYRDQNEFMPDEISSIALVAMFFAESAQQIRDLKGRKVSGMGLTFSRLIGGCSSIPLMIDQIGKFVNLINMQPYEKSEIQMYALKAKATFQFMQLFQSYINKLQLISAQYIQNVKYKEIFIQLAWILYIDCRENYTKSDINAKQENNCLLASVFYFMVRYSLQYIYPRALKIEKNSQKRTIIVKILEFLLDIFHIQEIELYKKVADKFDQYIEKLISNLVLKTVASETDFFNPNIIYLNFKQLQNKYQKRLQPKDIDYRVFRKEKSLTPIHKEALLHFAGVKKVSALSKSMKGQFRSHRALRYEDLDSPNQEVEKIKNNIQMPSLKAQPQIFIRKRNIQHKPHFSSSFIIRPTTVIPEGINTQIYRYVNTLIKSSQRTKRSLFFQNSFEKIQAKVLNNEKIHSGINKKSIYFTIYSVYVSLAQKIFTQQIQSQSMHNCIIAISFFIIYEMYEQLQNQQSICEFIIHKKTNYIDLWYCLKFFMQNDQNLPPQLFYEYQNEQQKIMCSLVWKNTQFIDQIAQLAANYEKDFKFVTFSETIILYCEKFIKTIINEIQVSNQISINAYNCMKYILSANGSILQDHHIDQILMCSIYIAGKNLGMPILFSRIKQAYETLFRDKNRNFQQIFNKIDTNQERHGDIIYFYNSSFINSIKPFLPYMGNPSLDLLHPLFQRQIIEQSYSRGNIVPVSMINIMETTKPKAKKSKSKPIQRKNHAFPFGINSERNETRVRIRPVLITQNQLCETQRMRSFDNQRYSSSEQQ